MLVREWKKIIILLIANTPYCLHVGNGPGHENLKGKDEEEYTIQIIHSTCDESSSGGGELLRG